MDSGCLFMILDVFMHGIIHELIYFLFDLA